MPFNLTKCKHLKITNKSPHTIYHYKINEHIIQTVKSAKYLDVTISHTLSWSEHISRITSKANLMLAFVQRNLYHCSQDIKAKAYLTFVRLILEYASIIWSPYIHGQIHQVEMVERRVANLFLIIFQDISVYHHF